MGVKCQILLKTGDNKFLKSGQTVYGTLHYIIDEVTTLASINVSFIGTLEGTDKDYISEEEIVSHQENILENEMKIEPGVYEKPFQFTLLENLPSSYKDKRCTISYKMFAVFKDVYNTTIRFESEIPVVGKVTLGKERRKSYGLTKTPFLINKPIDLDIEIKKPIVKAGESIRLDYLLSNEADIPVTGIVTRLISETTYVREFDSKYKKVDRRTKEEAIVKSKGTKEFSEIKLVCFVPTSPNQYSVQNSKYLSKDYRISVTVILPFPHRNISMDIPVVIEGANEVDRNLKCKSNIYSPISL